MRKHLQDRVSRSLFAGVLALTVLVVGHNLYFLLRYGSEYTTDLARTGDGGSWDAAVRFVLASAFLLTSVSSLRLAFLFQEVRRTYPGQWVNGISGAGYLRSVAPIWLKLFSASIPLFVLQENLERWGSGLSLPGIGAIGTVGLGSPLLVFALVSLAFAVVVALFRLGIDRLETLVAEARSQSWRPVRRADLPGGSDRESAPTSVIGRNLAGRAPPAVLLAFRRT